MGFTVFYSAYGTVIVGTKTNRLTDVVAMEPPSHQAAWHKNCIPMRLNEKLPPWLKQLFGMVEPTPESKRQELQRRVDCALQVTEVIDRPGWKVIEQEHAALDRVELEKFVGKEPLSYEGYLEQRGVVLGFRAQLGIAEAIVRQGVQAERRIDELDKQKRAIARKT